MLSVLDLFRIGIGPSSSHTVGPLRIAGRFVSSLRREKHFAKVARIAVHLRGSLAFTGVGHGTPDAVLMGLMGLYPATLDIGPTKKDVAAIKAEKRIHLNKQKWIKFDPDSDVIFDYEIAPELHPNEISMCAYDQAGSLLRQQTYYSTGGGFIASREQLKKPLANDIVKTGSKVPFPFTSAATLLDYCAQEDMACLLYTSPSPRDATLSRMPSSA